MFALRQARQMRGLRTAPADDGRLGRAGDRMADSGAAGVGELPDRRHRGANRRGIEQRPGLLLLMLP